MKQIILASASPRRKELLKKTGIKFKIVESEFTENIDLKLNPNNLVEKMSLGKAKAVYEKFNDSIIIAADTLVVCDNKVLGKPKNKKEAYLMLKLLSDKTHSIVTGLTIINNKKIITKSQATKVTMRTISNQEIDDYIKTKEPYDKAGGYAIQGWAKKFITKIDGDLSSAIGLPLNLLLKELSNSRQK
jgi:septum formation protein